MVAERSEGPRHIGLQVAVFFFLIDAILISCVWQDGHNLMGPSCLNNGSQTECWQSMISTQTWCCQVSLEKLRLNNGRTSILLARLGVCLDRASGLLTGSCRRTAVADFEWAARHVAWSEPMQQSKRQKGPEDIVRLLGLRRTWQLCSSISLSLMTMLFLF